MFRSPLRFAFLMLGAMAALPAAAQTATEADLADARCAASMAATADAVSGDDKTALQSGLMFYLGRISGRSGSAAVAPALEKGAQGLETVDLAKLTEQCANELEAITNGM